MAISYYKVKNLGTKKILRLKKTITFLLLIRIIVEVEAS